MRRRRFTILELPELAVRLSSTAPDSRASFHRPCLSAFKCLRLSR